MKKQFYTSILSVCFLSSLFTSLMVPQVQAATLSPEHGNVQVEAAIGQFYLNLSGYIAPYASVVMVVDGIVYKSVVADVSGNFYIAQVLVKEGFTHFCLDAVDVKRLGESEACFTIPPVHANYTRNNIFLPPTIGLFRTEVTVGSNAIVWGYSMPGAIVHIRFPDGTVIDVVADKNGYYEAHPKLDKVGTFTLFADATLSGKKSENPVKGVTLKAITTAQQVGQTIWDFLKKLFTFLFNLPLGPLWLAIPIIILILILLKKLRQGSPSMPEAKQGAHSVFDLFKRNKKLHHWWIDGVGY